MRRCLHLAQHGAGFVSPNPMVGAVIVKDGRKIAEGFHRRYGEAHAEINAISRALKQHRSLHGATIYVNLEPCSHYGKTPPCVDSILHHGFSRVVIASSDPNPLVSGKSIKLLRKRGIECTEGILKDEAIRLNEFFFKYITKKIPFVSMKAAQSSDGFIASDNADSRWITNRKSRTEVHRLRKNYDVIVAGAGTVMSDDPSLTVRHVKGTNPTRVIIDGKFSLPLQRNVFSADAPTILYTTQHHLLLNKKKAGLLRKQGVEIVGMSGRNGIVDIRQIIRDLGLRNHISVLVEGGQKTYAAFLNAKTADKLYLFTGKKKYKDGLKTFDNITVSFKLNERRKKQFGTDTLQEFDVIYS